MNNFFKSMPLAIDTDVKNKTALIVTIDCGCDLCCYGCHYFKTRRNVDKVGIEYVIKKIRSMIKLRFIDCIVLTGGEILLDSNMPVLRWIINEIRLFDSNVSIVINTNGQHPDNVKSLIKFDKNLIFHVDIKLSPLYFDVSDNIVGKPNYHDTYIKNLTKSLDYIYMTERTDHVLRTVKYPILKILPTSECTENQYFNEIHKFVDSINSKYNKQLNWYLNDYYVI